MNPILKKISQPNNVSFFVMEINEPRFYPSWHFHPEYELIFIEEGTGSKYLGNSIVPFGRGDLTLIGPNIPHLYKSKITNLKKSTTARAVVVYFRVEQFGKLFLTLPESRKIKEMLELSCFGINFSKNTVDQASPIIRTLPQKKGFEKILSFLTVLHLLSHSVDFNLITDSELSARLTSQDQRINMIYDYVMKNFKSEIKLSDAAEIACMNKNAFCRYFKKRTNLTFIGFLNELRISNACKLLAETEMPVKQICYDSGFNSFPSFLNLFKKKVELTPQQYRTIQQVKKF
jgi:AraC-like DNA-binding protein